MDIYGPVRMKTKHTIRVSNAIPSKTMGTWIFDKVLKLFNQFDTKINCTSVKRNLKEGSMLVSRGKYLVE